MKQGWEKKKLGELLEVQNGFAFDSKAFSPAGDMPLIRIRDLKGGTDTETYFTGEYEKKYVVKAGDLLIGMDGDFGCYEWKGSPALLNQRVCRLQNFRADISPRYIFYGINSHLKDIEEVTGYSTVKHISSKQILGIEFLFPPLLEQQRIVGILDKAFDAIAIAKANAEKNLRNARALFESYLNAVFTKRGEGWVEKSLGDVCDLLNGFAFMSGDVVSESKMQLVRMGNLYGNKLDLERNPVFYPDKFAADYERYLLHEGDLIMSLTGTTGKEDYGYTVRIPKCGHNLLMNQRIAKFVSIRSDVVNVDYLLYYLRSRAFLDILYPTANGTRQANLSSVTIKTLPIPLCSIPEQAKVSTALDELSVETQRLESIYQRKLVALDELKKSFLHQAFSGEL